MPSTPNAQQELSSQGLEQLAAQVKQWGRKLGFQQVGITDTDLHQAERQLHDWLEAGLHGDMEQDQREAVIKGFKGAGVDILVATDVAARGLHINDVSHVINYHIPFDSESYVHRIGRTGRAGNKGVAITLVTPHEFKELQRIKSKVGTTMEHCYIPTKGQVIQNRLGSLADEIIKQKVFDEAQQIVAAIGDSFDHETALYKVISVLLRKEPINGPETIGLNEEKLAKVLARMESRGNSGGGRGGYRGNRNRSGGNRSGGGGGYRGNRDGGSRDGGGNRSRSGGNRDGGGSRERY